MFRSAAVFVLATATTLTAVAQPNRDSDTPRITVSGEATVYVQPDKILINLGVETWDMDVVVAKTKNNETMGKAVAAIKALGVAQGDIQTDQLSIEPRWRDQYEKSRQDRETFLGYFVRNTLVVTLKDVTKVEPLVTNVLESGVNYLNGIQFQSTAFKKHREEAREMALKAAQEKATKMAGVFNKSIVRVHDIQEYPSNPWYGSSWGNFGGGRGYAMSQNAIAEQPGGANPEISDTIALGKIAITANVSVTFELER